MKKHTLIILMFLAISHLLPALGKTDEADFREVEGEENWNYEYDISDYKPGKYNVLIRSRDEAGNIGTAGPVNILIDPESDLPVARITWPSDGEILPGDVNILGLALDDDGVSHVELRIDDGPWQQVTGRYYWSYTLSTDLLEDGEHTLSVRGTDISQVEGHPRSIRFILDSQAADIRVLSPANGAILSGKVRIEGTVFEPNDLKSLTVREDGETEWRNLKFKGEKDSALYNWAMDLDTRDLAEGPAVFWFRTLSDSGRESMMPCLFFIDNKGPELTVLSPVEGDAVSGTLHFFGKAEDSVGLSDLVLMQPGETEGTAVPLYPGDPYWTARAVVPPGKSRKLEYRFIATDISGNQTTRTVKVEYDAEEDRPVLSLFAPAADETVPSRTALAGFISADGPAELEYALDRGEFVSLPAEDHFVLPLEDLAAGEHTVTLRPVDSRGIRGEEVVRSFRVLPSLPGLILDAAVKGSEEMPFHPGLILPDSWKGTLQGRLTGGDEIVRLSAAVGDAGAVELRLKPLPDSADRTFSLPLSAKGQDGLVNIRLEMEEPSGRITRRNTAVLIIPVPEEKDAPLPEPSAAPGLYVPDAGSSEPIYTTPDLPVRGFALGGQVRSVSLIPADAPFKVREEEGRITLIPDGEVPETTLQIEVVLKNGRSYRSGSLVLYRDAAGPVMTGTLVPGNPWLTSGLSASGTLEDSSLPVGLNWSVTDRDGTVQLDGSLQPDGEVWMLQTSLDSLPEGEYLLSLHGRDAAGNPASLRFPFYRDTTPPVLSQMTPSPEDIVDGKTTLSGLVVDDGSVALVEYSSDGETWEALADHGVFIRSENLTPREGQVLEPRFRAVDRAGNSTLFTPVLNPDPARDRPTVEIQLPRDGALFDRNREISGMAFDDDGIGAFHYQLDDGEWQTIEGSSSFAIPVEAESMEERDYTFRIQAEDIFGLKGDVVEIGFTISLSGPETEVTAPLLEETVRGKTELTGLSSDPNGVLRHSISTDNGVSWTLMEGTEEWTYQLDTALLPDGNHSLLIRSEDRTGMTSLQTMSLRIDNTPPALTLNRPLSGQESVSLLEMEGKAADGGELMQLQVFLQPLETPESGGEAEPGDPAAAAEPLFIRDLTTGPGGLFTLSETLEDEPAGLYNLTVKAVDRAGNESMLSRNVILGADAREAEVDLIYPLAGEQFSGRFALEGRIAMDPMPRDVLLLMDGAEKAVIPLEGNGTVRTVLTREDLPEGEHRFALRIPGSENESLRSEEKSVFFTGTGPWIEITSHRTGEKITGRPWLEGTAGWLAPEGVEEDRKAQFPEVRKIDISMDNGHTFQPVSGKEEWKFRLETQDYSDGDLRLLVRGEFSDGTTAVSRCLLQVDDTPPEVALLLPEEGSLVNGSVMLLGEASDENGLAGTEAIIREGDKGRYEVPSFIQGLYVDAHFMGATYYEIGVGLTFFDDNVKLQGQFGQAPPGRFDGNVWGMKLLANILKMPFGYWFGPGWDFYSMSLAVGANFSYFTMQESPERENSDGVVLGAVLTQWEFAKFSFPDNRYLGYVSLYAEGSFWFISSDVNAGVVPKLSLGMRMGLF